jgi:hypothetical protein
MRTACGRTLMACDEPESEIVKAAEARISGMVGAIGGETVSPDVMIASAWGDIG